LTRERPSMGEGNGRGGRGRGGSTGVRVYKTVHTNTTCEGKRRRQPGLGPVRTRYRPTLFPQSSPDGPAAARPTARRSRARARSCSPGRAPCCRVGNKKTHPKNPPKKTPKNQPKNVFFGVFFLKFLIFYENNTNFSL
jgi:hypothetical protein